MDKIDLRWMFTENILMFPKIDLFKIPHIMILSLNPESILSTVSSAKSKEGFAQNKNTRSNFKAEQYHYNTRVDVLQNSASLILNIHGIFIIFTSEFMKPVRQECFADRE